MRKRKKGRKLHRKKDQRGALLKSLARPLFLNEKIKTVEARAKEVRRLAERSITLAKSGQSSEKVATDKKKGSVGRQNSARALAVRRRLLKTFNRETVKKLIEEIAPRFSKRRGGYTRIIKLGQRASDGAKMVMIELVK